MKFVCLYFPQKVYMSMALRCVLSSKTFLNTREVQIKIKYKKELKIFSYFEFNIYKSNSL